MLFVFKVSISKRRTIENPEGTPPISTSHTPQVEAVADASCDDVMSETLGLASNRWGCGCPWYPKNWLISALASLETNSQTGVPRKMTKCDGSEGQGQKGGEVDICLSLGGTALKLGRSVG